MDAEIYAAAVNPASGEEVWVSLPASEEKITRLLQNIGGPDIDYTIRAYEAELDDICVFFSEFESLNELNYLAVRLNALDPHERELLGAVLKSGEPFGSVAALINLTKNLDSYDLQPAYIEEQYGEFLALMQH